MTNFWYDTIWGGGVGFIELFWGKVKYGQTEDKYKIILLNQSVGFLKGDYFILKRFFLVKYWTESWVVSVLVNNFRLCVVGRSLRFLCHPVIISVRFPIVSTKDPILFLRCIKKFCLWTSLFFFIIKQRWSSLMSVCTSFSVVVLWVNRLVRLIDLH